MAHTCNTVNNYIFLFNFIAVIEHVRDGCTVRAFLLPDFYHVTIMITGIKVCWSQELICAVHNLQSDVGSPQNLKYTVQFAVGQLYKSCICTMYCRLCDASTNLLRRDDCFLCIFNYSVQWSDARETKKFQSHLQMRLLPCTIIFSIYNFIFLCQEHGDENFYFCATLY